MRLWPIRRHRRAPVPQPAPPASPAPLPPKPADRWSRFLVCVLIVCGGLSLLWVLAIGAAVLFPSVVPHTSQSTCSSETEVSTRTSSDSEPKPGASDTTPASVTQSVKTTHSCQPMDIPSSHIIAAGALTAFFFMGIVAPMVGPIGVKTPLIEYQGAPPPSDLTAAAANAADAGKLRFESNPTGH